MILNTKDMEIQYVKMTEENKELEVVETAEEVVAETAEESRFTKRFFG